MGLFRHVSFCRTGWERCSFQLGSGVGSIGSAQYRFESCYLPVISFGRQPLEQPDLLCNGAHGPYGLA